MVPYLAKVQISKFNILTSIAKDKQNSKIVCIYFIMMHKEFLTDLNDQEMGFWCYFNELKLLGGSSWVKRHSSIILSEMLIFNLIY